MKIYTKTGDKGETGLLGGGRVLKSHPAIEVCGALDETNSWLGLARSESLSVLGETILTQVQNDLFELGSRVADCGSPSRGQAVQLGLRTAALEQWIDEIQAELPPLKVFILPGGSRAGSLLHLARSVCRRSERELVGLMETRPVRDLSDELRYLNRLGDLLFVLARSVNREQGILETEWRAE